MVTPEPESPAPEPKRRRRRSTATAETAAPAETTSDAPPKPRRRRKTKAEKEAERAAKLAADAEKPLLEPKAWMIFGLLLLILGVCIYLDPIGFEQAGQSNDESWIKILLELLIAFLGKNPVSIALGGLGLLALGLGFRGWLKERISVSKQK